MALSGRRTSLLGSQLRRGKLGDRGAAAVEAAIILPLLITLTFGIIEFALLMRDHTATTSLVRAGARTASALPRSPVLVATTVDAMEKAGSALPKSSYEELWVYQAKDDGFPVNDIDKVFQPADCSSNCVRYAWDGDEFKPASGSGWTVTNINACPGDPNAQAVGVYLKAKHTWLTGLFFDTTTVADRAVLKFEPLSVYNCK